MPPLTFGFPQPLFLCAESRFQPRLLAVRLVHYNTLDLFRIPARSSISAGAPIQILHRLGCGRLPPSLTT